MAECRGITVRPFGANDTFPPRKGDGDPDGFRIVVELQDEGTLKATITAEMVLVSAPGLFTRWISKAVGGIEGGEQFEAPAMNEEFRVT